jgi:hypothetical protein
VLELVEEALDEIALAVDAAVDRSVDEPLAGRGDMGFGAGGSDQVEQAVGVIATIGHDVAASQAGQQIGRRLQVVGLAGGQHQADRQAVLIDDGIDLGAQSSTRAADGVIRAPFFPPAACWWARMIELSIKAMEPGDLAAKVSNTRTQTPARAHRLKRL